MFYTIIVIKLGAFESSIIDERHFGDKTEAEEFRRKMNKENYITVMTKLKANLVA